MARKYYPFPRLGYWPPPEIPELPPLLNPDPRGISESRDQAISEDRSVASPCNTYKVNFQQLRILEADTLDGTWAGNQTSPARQQSGARIDDPSLWSILYRPGYTVVDDRGSGARRILELGKPGDFDAQRETLKPGRRGTKKGKV